MVPPQLVVLVAGIDAADINRLGQHARCIPVFAHMGFRHAGSLGVVIVSADRVGNGQRFSHRRVDAEQVIHRVAVLGAG